MMDFRWPYRQAVFTDAAGEKTVHAWDAARSEPKTVCGKRKGIDFRSALWASGRSRSCTRCRTIVEKRHKGKRD